MAGEETKKKRMESGRKTRLQTIVIERGEAEERRGRRAGKERSGEISNRRNGGSKRLKESDRSQRAKTAKNIWLDEYRK